MVSGRVSIIVVNWNGMAYLPVCFASVMKQTYRNFSVVMVDNGSTDGSVQYVKDNFPTVQLVCVPRNVGFAEGNNVGFRAALQDPAVEYIAPLNNDTEVESGWLAALVAAAEGGPRVGAVCSKMLMFDRRDTLDSVGDYLLPGSWKVAARGYRQADRGQYDRLEECFSARAGAALYRREMLASVALGAYRDQYFDGTYFAYIEDTDLSIRARLASWRILYAPQARVYHKVAATSSRLSYAFRRYYSGRNRVMTAVKNYPFRLWLAAIQPTPSVDAGYRLSLAGALLVYLKIIASVCYHLPHLWRSRRRVQRLRTVSTQEVLQWSKRFSMPRY